MTLRRFSTTIFILILSIPVILTTAIIIDLQVFSASHKLSTRFYVYIIALFVMMIAISTLLLIFFTKLYDFFEEIQQKTQSLSNGNLNESVLNNSEKDSKVSEATTILQNLEKMRISLIEAQNQTNRFIMGISHDIRTPIAIIKGYTEALSDGILSTQEEQKNALDLIAAKTEQLEGITESLIDFTRMDVNDLREQFDSIQIQELLSYFAKSCNLTLSLYERNFTHSIDIPPNIYIRANRNLTMRALDNLFSNAIRYTKDGDSIKLSAVYNENGIQISLKDSGIGIDEKELNFIFNLFYRGTNATYENGLGIGLAVVHNITEIHGWKVTCESEKDKGSCFTITIPPESCSSI